MQCNKSKLEEVMDYFCLSVFRTSQYFSSSAAMFHTDTKWVLCHPLFKIFIGLQTLN